MCGVWMETSPATRHRTTTLFSGGDQNIFLCPKNRFYLLQNIKFLELKLKVRSVRSVQNFSLKLEFSSTCFCAILHKNKLKHFGGGGVLRGGSGKVVDKEKSSGESAAFEHVAVVSVLRHHFLFSHPCFLFLL